jgi:hypothetical protein
MPVLNVILTGSSMLFDISRVNTATAVSEAQ